MHEKEKDYLDQGESKQTKQEKIKAARAKLREILGDTPDDPQKRKEIKEKAQEMINIYGVRENVSDYPLPKDLAGYKDYYLTCLWKILWEKKETIILKPLTSAGISVLAKEYKHAPTVEVRYLILEIAHVHGGRAAVRALALALGIDAQKFLSVLRSWRKMKNRIRRRRVPIIPQLPPDLSFCENEESSCGKEDPFGDAKEIAELACGFFPEQRYARRDTHSCKGPTCKKARRFKIRFKE